MKIILYHIHNKICKHSTNETKKIVEYAIKNHYKAIYFCEHCPLKNTHSKHYQYSRPKYHELNLYKQEIDFFRNKYKNKIKLYLGYETECSYVNRYYFEKLARDPICEFMICGDHFYNDVLKEQQLNYTAFNTTSQWQIKLYWKNLEAALKSNLYSWIAHPEIFLNSYQQWDSLTKNILKKIIKSAIKYDIPLGFNINYLPPKMKWHYPVKKFWRMVAKTKAKVIIENDSHDIATIQKKWIKDNYQLAYDWGLEKNIVFKPKINFFDKKPKIIFIERNIKQLLQPSFTLMLTKNHCKLVEFYNKNLSYFKNYLRKKKINQVWSIIVSNNQKLCNLLSKHSSCFIVSKNNVDLSIKEFIKIENLQQLINLFQKA